LSSCSSSSVINIYYNFKPPISSPSISAPGYICNGSALLSSGSSTPTSGVPGASLTNFCWQGPSPQTPTCGPSIYTAFIPGTFTLSVTDSNNGCNSAGTINVAVGASFSLAGMAPAIVNSCDGYVIITPSALSGHTISVNMGSLSQNTVSNLCYGNLKVCFTNTANACKTCDSLLINGATTIKEYREEENFVLYPNPASSSFFIIYPDNRSGILKVYNPEGKEIESRELTHETQIRNLKEGIYFVEIKTGSGTFRKKVIVLKD
jgi:hypothetical protein